EPPEVTVRVADATCVAATDALPPVVTVSVADPRGVGGVAESVSQSIAAASTPSPAVVKVDELTTRSQPKKTARAGAVDPGLPAPLPTSASPVSTAVCR